MQIIRIKIKLQFHDSAQIINVVNWRDNEQARYIYILYNI